MINALADRNAPVALKKIDEIWSLDSKIEYTATGAVFFWLNQVIRARELVERKLPDAAIGTQLRLWPPDRAQRCSPWPGLGARMARHAGAARCSRWTWPTSRAWASRGGIWKSSSWKYARRDF